MEIEMEVGEDGVKMEVKEEDEVEVEESMEVL